MLSKAGRTKTDMQFKLAALSDIDALTTLTITTTQKNAAVVDGIGASLNRVDVLALDTVTDATNVVENACKGAGRLLNDLLNTTAGASYKCGNLGGFRAGRI